MRGTLSPKRKQTQMHRYPGVEAYLQTTLKPVTPRPAFVSGLKTRLVTVASNKEANRQVFGYVLLTLIGVAGGTLFIATGLRAALSLAGMIGLFRLARDHSQTRRSTVIAS